MIGCTNRRDILDPAITRPGRLDRLIYVPTPEREGIEEIFKIHSSKMNIGEVNLDRIYSLMEGMSGAEIKSVCTEAGYFALREEKYVIEESHLVAAISKVREEEDSGADHFFS